MEPPFAKKIKVLCHDIGVPTEVDSFNSQRPV
jgi:hypothetical protein